jgi:hypothetical protein
MGTGLSRTWPVSGSRFRRRWVLPHEAAVWCPGGRWGPRRTRVSECYSVLRAEDMYTEVLKLNALRIRPGAAGTVEFTVEGRTHVAQWEVRQNAVWRHGRVFLQCSRCKRRCTRLYLPLATSWLRDDVMVCTTPHPRRFVCADYCSVCAFWSYFRSQRTMPTPRSSRGGAIGNVL